MQASGTSSPLLSRLVAPLSVAALLLVAAPAPDAHAQVGGLPSCSTLENCFCAPAGASGVYEGIVVGADQTGGQVEIDGRVAGSGTIPDIFVHRNLTSAEVGKRVLISDNGFLVQYGTEYGCPSSSYSAGLRMSRPDVLSLMRADSCFMQLNQVSISGVYPECVDDGDGSFACAAAPGTSPQPGALLFAIGAALIASRRRRR